MAALTDAEHSRLVGICEDLALDLAVDVQTAAEVDIALQFSLLSNQRINRVSGSIVLVLAVRSDHFASPHVIKLLRSSRYPSSCMSAGYEPPVYQRAQHPPARALV